MSVFDVGIRANIFHNVFSEKSHWVWFVSPKTCQRFYRRNEYMCALFAKCINVCVCVCLCVYIWRSWKAQKQRAEWGWRNNGWEKRGRMKKKNTYIKNTVKLFIAQNRRIAHTSFGVRCGVEHGMCGIANHPSRLC